jgi:hypothetical protein
MTLHKFSDKELKAIAVAVDAGNLVFVNRTSGFVVELSPADVEADDYEQKYRDYLEQPDVYLTISKIGNEELLSLANDFAWQLPEGNMKKDVVYALSRKDPWAAFREELDMMEPLRREWFRFRGAESVKRVRRLLELE